MPPQAPRRCPAASCSTMIRHMPTPSTRAPKTPNRILPMSFQLIFTFLRADNGHDALDQQSHKADAAVQMTPVLKAFHSGSRHIHIPRANSRPLTVPTTRLTKQISFISTCSPFLFDLWPYLTAALLPK